MKKIIYLFGAALLTLGVASCGKSGAETDANKAFADSLSVTYGQFTGSSWLANYQEIPADERGKYKKESIIRGIEQIVLADTADQGYLAGINIGMQLMQQLYRYEQSGIPVDRKAYMKEFAKAFKDDTVNQLEITRLSQEFQMMNAKAMQLAMQKREKDLAAEREAQAKAPEAVENAQLGEKFITTAKAEDPAIKTTESGLSYKVVKEGTGLAVGPKGRATVKYVGKFIDGTEFDSSDKAIFTPNGVIPGFGEGLEMMQKGGSYVLYIPGELAYGPTGTGNIPPMATLIFEVEVLDVEP